MNFRISTLLLLVAVLCIGLGWIVDHVSLKRRSEILLNGAAVHDDAVRYVLLARRLKDSPDNLAGHVRAKLIRDVLDLHKNSTSINSFLESLGSSNTASFVANDILDTLDCNTADEYFETFRTQYNWDIYDEFKDSATIEHRRFRAFISMSIANERPESDVELEFNQLFQGQH
jgi:hypothetical protein